MKKFLAILLLLCSVLMSPSCVSIKNGFKQKVKMGGYSGLSGNFTDGFRINIDISNDTTHNIHLTDAKGVFYLNGDEVANIKLADKVTVKKKWHGKVVVPFRLQMKNPLKSLWFLAKLEMGNVEGITIDYSATARVSLFSKSISQKGVKAEQVLKKVKK